MEKNERYFRAIEQSRFGSVSRLAEHLGLSYRNVQSYGLLERRPVDRKGVVKYDVAGICRALDCGLEDLFPSDAIDRPYRFLDSYEGYGKRAAKTPRQRFFQEREITPDQAQAVLALLEFREMVPDDLGHAFATLLVRRLKPAEYAVVARVHFEGDEAPLRYGEGKIYERARRWLNLPSNLRLLTKLKEESAAGIEALEYKMQTANRVELTNQIVARLWSLRNRSGIGPVRLFSWAESQGIEIPEGVTAQPLVNALGGRTKTIAAPVLAFAESAWEAAAAEKGHAP